MHEFEYIRGATDPDELMQRIIDETGRPREIVQVFVNAAMREETPEELEHLSLLTGSPVEDLRSRSTIFTIPTEEEERELKERNEERKRKCEELLQPIMEEIGEYVWLNAPDDVEARLREVNSLGIILAGKCESSEQVLDWLFGNSEYSDSLWGSSPIDLVASGDRHQWTTVMMEAFNAFPKPGQYRLQMPNSIGEALRNIDKPQKD